MKNVYDATFFSSFLNLKIYNIEKRINVKVQDRKGQVD